MRKFWLAISLIFLWLAFECWISWAAFCHPDYDQAAYNEAYQEYCAFRGPAVSIVGFLWGWTVIALHTRDKEIIAAFTVILTISTIMLWISTRNAARIAEQSLTQLECAFVALKPFVILASGYQNFAQQWEISTTWYNSGKTPTRGLHAHTSWDHFEHELPDSFNFPDLLV